MDTSNLDVIALVYLAVGAVLHFLIVQRQLFADSGSFVNFLALYGLASGGVWALFLFTWPIWLMALLINRFLKRR